MKILNSPFKLSLALFTLISPFAKGQNFIENSFPVKTTTHATAIPGGWVVPMNSSDCNRNWIVKYNSSTGTNKKFFEADTIGTPSFIIYDIAQLPSGALLCAGMAGLGTDIPPTHPYIFKMDLNGKILWNAYFQPDKPDMYKFLIPFIKVVSSPDGSIYALTSDNYLGKTDSTGHIIWIKQVPGVSDIAWTSKGLTATYNNGLTLLDTSGNVIKVYYPASSGNLTGLENGTNGSLYAMNANNIYKLDSTFQLTDSMQFTGYGTGTVTPQIITYADDSSYYFAHANSIKAFDLKGNLRWTNYLPSDCNITGLTSNGNQLAVTGSTTNSSFIKTYNIDGTTAPFPRDVSITKLKPISSVLHITGLHEGTVECKIEATIQNNGNETIDSLYLFSKGQLSAPEYSCIDEYLLGFHHLNLAQGDTTTLHLTISRYWAGSPDSSYNLSINLYTSSPNGKLDFEPTNDIATYSTTVLGINENQLQLSSIHIYPNPADNILHIDNNTGANTSISISDITGKQIMAIENPKNQFDLDVSGLPSGIYFVKARNENGMNVEKLVKN